MALSVHKILGQFEGGWWGNFFLLVEIWEKFAWQQDNCTRRTQVLFVQLFVSANFSQNCSLIHVNTY